MSVLNLFQIFVDLVRLVINLGLDYEDIEGISIQVCEVLLGFEGYRGDIICPGVVPNYGPHVSTFEFTWWLAGLGIPSFYLDFRKEKFDFKYAANTPVSKWPLSR